MRLWSIKVTHTSLAVPCGPGRISVCYRISVDCETALYIFQPRTNSPIPQFTVDRTETVSHRRLPYIFQPRTNSPIPQTLNLLGNDRSTWTSKFSKKLVDQSFDDVYWSMSTVRGKESLVAR